MENTNYNNDRLNTEVETDGKEPATAHDVKEGGALGAVGGAVVGAIAGGPLGAVIGAVAGGAASAGAVDVVDKHDNDYEQTMARHNTTATGTVDGRTPDELTEDDDLVIDNNVRTTNRL